jgi:hypothetical protein
VSFSTPKAILDVIIVFSPRWNYRRVFKIHKNGQVGGTADINNGYACFESLVAHDCGGGNQWLQYRSLVTSPSFYTAVDITDRIFYRR